MDGNRRWAQKQGMAPWNGHRKGIEPIKTAVEFCLKKQIPYLSLYTFSLENLKRPQEELDYLFNMLAQEMTNEKLNELYQQGIKVRFVGDQSAFPDKLRATINDITERTASGDKLTLNILFCYGGQQEIVNATKKIVAAIQNGSLNVENITPETFNHYTWLGDQPHPDLIIRTANVKRLSNFLTFQSAYSELLFLECYWPDMTEKDFEKALNEFYSRKRSFGV